ncbi:MAG: Jag N-terminal domain-containing protein [Acidimicrobiales bacterium]|nr:Jag N-terminal domain-containing protein [Acidimicrobiales bacterium]
MEWVVTTGSTVEEAKDAALDQLGVDEQEAEFELLEEPRTGLFGRVRGEAKVRARVKPRQPRAKAERGARRRRGDNGGRGRGGRNRNRGKGGDAKNSGDGRNSGDGKSSGDGKASSAGASAGEDRDERPEAPAPEAAGDGPGPANDAAGAPEAERATGSGDRSGRNRGRRGGRNRNRNQRPTGDGENETTKEQAMSEDVTVDEQAEIIEGFLDGLVEAFGVDAEIRRERVDDENVELDLVGADLGLLIGPKGRTLWAIQELSRTVVQRQASGTHHGRVRVDVGGYRQRRKEALERFTRQVAQEVLDSGVARSLEPMGAADRKIVHDTVNELDGIATTSEGEEPRRRVVIVPAD